MLREAGRGGTQADSNRKGWDVRTPWRYWRSSFLKRRFLRVAVGMSEVGHRMREYAWID